MEEENQLKKTRATKNKKYILSRALKNQSSTGVTNFEIISKNKEEFLTLIFENAKDYVLSILYNKKVIYIGTFNDEKKTIKRNKRIVEILTTIEINTNELKTLL